MSTTKKDRVREARQLLTRARQQADAAAVDSWEPADPAECVTKCFYAMENALSAAVVAIGEKRTKKHYEKAELAEKLAKSGKLKTDVSARLIELNDLRKNVQYGEPGEELTEVSLEDLVAQAQSFVEEVEELVDGIENT